MFLFVPYHLLDAFCRIAAARVFQAVRNNHKQSVRGYILGAGIFVNVTDMVNGAAECVQKRGTAADKIGLFGHRLHGLQINAVIQNLCRIRKQNRGNIHFSVLFFLFFEHGVKPADCVLLQAVHRSASIQNEHQFCCVVFYLFFVLHFRFLLKKTVAIGVFHLTATVYFFRHANRSLSKRQMLIRFETPFPATPKSRPAPLL